MRGNAAIAVLCCCLIAFGSVQAQRLVNWTQSSGDLPLGYPVPIPVDTADAFDGFRSYQGLHMKHQDLMMNSDNITGTIIGQTIEGRDIWAYTFSDPDQINRVSELEYSSIFQGGIHAREWQSHEAVTGFMEYLADNQNDQYWVEYLLDNSQLIIIPVLNIDGFVHTQRFPEQSYLDSGPFPVNPRDGRMRRKNMRDVDTTLTTSSDHLLGVDLNRNNLPAFASGNDNSSDTDNILYHGSAAGSEPEIQAMQQSVTLAPPNRLRLFADVHSYGSYLIPVRNLNLRRNNIQQTVLDDFEDFQFTQPGNRMYPSRTDLPTGIGSAAEYFAQTEDIPAFSIEIEPSNFGGLDYGGFGGTEETSHTGFILPESEIRRVRGNMSLGFTLMHYNMAGPPAVTAVQWYDVETGALVFNAEWDVTGALQQSLHTEQIQPLQLDRQYTLVTRFSKPMRWREGQGATTFPGLNGFEDDLNVTHATDSSLLLPVIGNSDWLDQPGRSSTGYRHYRDDSHAMSVSFSRADNESRISDLSQVTLALDVRDMAGNRLDANPATVVDFMDGHWTGLENREGEQLDNGGPDRTIRYTISNQSQAEPYLIGAEQTAAWFDPSHDGEGFVIEILDDGRAVLYWFTYDVEGNQRWFVGIGEIRANELYFPELLVTSGGIFGDDFDPAQVVRQPAGSAHFIFSDCNSATMSHDVTGINLRQSLIRLTTVSQLPCEGPQAANRQSVQSSLPPVTGSWYDQEHSGEGFVIEELSANQVIVYWFTYDDAGNQSWIFGDGEVTDNRITIDDARLFTGGQFGDDFDPADVESTSWGQMAFEFGCNTGAVAYDSTIAGYGSGSQALSRLTYISGVECE